MEDLRRSNKARETRQKLHAGQREYYQAELDLNSKLRTFAVNCSLIYNGQNTVLAQLKNLSNRAYTEIGADDELPLGEEFQQHLQQFYRHKEKRVNKKLELVVKLVAQLEISTNIYAKLKSETKKLEQEDLDVRSMQLLRAIIHNEERRLPEDWEERAADFKKEVSTIKLIQDELNTMGAVVNVLPHLAKTSDAIAKEVLSFISIMLLNANENVQSSLLYYFLHTREESFFAAVRNKMQLSALAIKEKRALVVQFRARTKEILAQSKSMQTSLIVGKQVVNEIQQVDSYLRSSRIGDRRKVSLATLQKKAAEKNNGVKKLPKVTSEPPTIDPKSNGIVAKSKTLKMPKKSKTRSKEILIPLEETETMTNTINEEKLLMSKNNKSSEPADVETPKNNEDSLEDLDQNKDGCIELVLQVLARMCDGQHRGLQNYLREQPDNIKSFNIVAETAQFVNLVYSNISSKNVDLCIQLFLTLNEFTVGNYLNRSVMLNNKVIDYINFILRTGEFTGCSVDKVLDLKLAIGSLILSIIEENSEENLVIATEIKDTLDKEALYKSMASCYNSLNNHSDKLSLPLQSGKSNHKNVEVLARAEDLKDPDLKDKLEEVGFKYYIILARLVDIDPKINYEQELSLKPEQKVSYDYYQKNSMSIEIVKDNDLQKINFRVKNKNVIRDEVKEKLTWNVDRSSPSSKIRDLIKWSNDILIDIYYQRRVLSNKIATFFTKNWLLWNYVVILLSVVINILMLVMWDTKPEGNMHHYTSDDIDGWENVPAELKNVKPRIKQEADYDIALSFLGSAHIFFSIIIVITYFLSNHPTPPDLCYFFRKIRTMCVKKEEENVGTSASESKLEVKLLSFTTLYYLVFLLMSAAGLYFKGYFFAFHLLNIVNTNQLLRGVIQAVTQNGQSLLWVGVLGIIIFYLYSIIAFAFFRPWFNLDNQMFCGTLYECFVTILYYGLIGEIFPTFKNTKADNDFEHFGYLVLFNTTFFIFVTTIGLNIIFGIIVDTFSELRNNKWLAERDMLDTCFICSRSSYDFEHHGSGFEHHINEEHCIWSYIFYFIHLNDTKQGDYTALDLYVNQLRSMEKTDFFPLNRALSLKSMDEDSTESKVDELLKQINELVMNQKAEEQRKKRDEERLRQLRWKEEHRLELLQRNSSAISSKPGTKHGSPKKPLYPISLSDALSRLQRESVDDHGPFESPGAGSGMRADSEEVSKTQLMRMESISSIGSRQRSDDRPVAMIDLDSAEEDDIDTLRGSAEELLKVYEQSMTLPRETAMVDGAVSAADAAADFAQAVRTRELEEDDEEDGDEEADDEKTTVV